MRQETETDKGTGLRKVSPTPISSRTGSNDGESTPKMLDRETWRWVKQILRSGFQQQNEPIHDDIYRLMLAAYTRQEIEAAISDVATSQGFRPSPAEIIVAIHARRPAKSHDYAMSPEAVALIEARKAHIEALDLAETERRDRWLDEWTAASEKGMILPYE